MSTNQDFGNAWGGQQMLAGVSDVAMLLGVSEQTVRRRVADGSIPQGVRIGNLRRWDRAALERWIASGCPRPSAEGADRA